MQSSFLPPFHKDRVGDGDVAVSEIAHQWPTINGAIETRAPASTVSPPECVPENRP
jgi:hypothetical protein